MERLTKTDKVGSYLVKCRENPCENLKGKCGSCAYMQQAIERLAEYESLGVILEQVQEMDALFQKKREEVHRLKKENERLNHSLTTAKEALEKVIQAIWESTV